MWWKMLRKFKSAIVYMLCLKYRLFIQQKCLQNAYGQHSLFNTYLAFTIYQRQPMYQNSNSFFDVLESTSPHYLFPLIVLQMYFTSFKKKIPICYKQFIDSRKEHFQTFTQLWSAWPNKFWGFVAVSGWSFRFQMIG